MKICIFLSLCFLVGVVLLIEEPRFGQVLAKFPPLSESARADRNMRQQGSVILARLATEHYPWPNETPIESLAKLQSEFDRKNGSEEGLQEFSRSINSVKMSPQMGFEGAQKDRIEASLQQLQTLVDNRLSLYSKERNASFGNDMRY